MEKDLKKLEEEREKLLLEVSILEQKKNEIVTRLIEIQGVVKFMKEGDNKQIKPEAK